MQNVSIQVTLRSGHVLNVSARAGESLMTAARANGADEIEALCGGASACATCHVYVLGEQFNQLEPMGSLENDLLDCSAHRQPHSRLACQVTVQPHLQDMRVMVAPQD